MTHSTRRKPLLALALLAASAPWTEAQAGTAADRARERDASADRGLITSHADTIGAGNWSFNSYQLLGAGLTYAFTDDFQLSVSTLLQVLDDQPFVLGLAPKLVLWRGEKTTLSAQVQSFFVPDEQGGLTSAGLAIDQYLDDGGYFIVHAGVQAGAAFANVDDVPLWSDGFLGQLDLGLTAGLSENFKLLASAKLIAAYSDGKFELVDGALVSYGVRFHGQKLAADLGFLKFVVEDWEDPFVLGLPYVSFSARF